MFRPMDFPPASSGAAIGGLHDAGSAAGADDEPARFVRQTIGPFRNQSRKFPRFAIVAAERASLVHPRRAEEHDGVVDLLVAEMRERLQIFRENPQLPGVRAVQKRFVLIRDRAPRRRADYSESLMQRVCDAQPHSSSATRFSNCLIVRTSSGSFGKAVIARQPIFAVERRAA